jgi:hypothetical protein
MTIQSLALASWLNISQYNIKEHFRNLQLVG